MAPNLAKADMWKADADMVCITTNGVIQQGKLLMGGGTALQAKERFPALPGYAATEITRHYGYLVTEGKKSWHLHGFQRLEYNETIFGKYKHHLALFQTKGLVSRDSSLALIGYSVMMLLQFATTKPKWKIALPFPGIGHGHLTPTMVMPLLADLPENVTVYTQ